VRGSVTKKGEKFYIVVDLEREGGKRKQKWISNPAWTTKRAAEKDLPQILANANAGAIQPGKALTVSELMQRWYNHTRPAVRQSSERSYLWAIKHINTHFAGTGIDKLRAHHIDEFINKKIDGGLSNTSARTLYGILFHALRKAVVWGLIPTNPCAGATRPRKSGFKAKVFNTAELKKLIISAEGTPAYLPILLAVSCGMRRGEICALRWRDVDFETSTLNIRHTIYEGAGLQPVKTDSGNRAILMPASLIPVLAEARAKQAADDINGLDSYVFAKPCGGHYNPNYVWQQFRIVCATARLPIIRFHDLRHSHATFLLMRGVPIKAVSERLGHSSTSFTMDVYSSVLQTMQQQAADTTDGLF
jgi:integrase